MAETIPPPPDPKDYFPADVLAELEALSSQTHPRLAAIAAERLEQYREFYAQATEQASELTDGSKPIVILFLGAVCMGLGIAGKDIFTAGFGACIAGASALQLSSRKHEQQLAQALPNTRAELIGGYKNRLLINNRNAEPQA